LILMRLRVAIAAAVIAAGCGPQAPPPPPKRPPLDPGLLKAWKREFFDFAVALRMIGSGNAVDVQRGLDRAAGMAPYEYFHWMTPGDQELVERARTGDAAAVRELARRGEVLDAVQSYSKPEDRSRWKETDHLSWDAARKRIVAAGPDMAEYLSGVLASFLLQSSNAPVYREIRWQLVQLGQPALRILIAFMVTMADTAADTPIGRWDELVQVIAALAGFGDAGAEGVQAACESPKRYVRAAAARAIGESMAVNLSRTLAKMLHEDRDWEVRTAAAEALGNLRGGEKSCKPLLDALAKERDFLVVQKILLALGRAGCVDAVPKLINALEDPRIESSIRESAAEALYDLTGLRLTKISDWQKWYRDDYPAWRLKRGK
jgi:hypothetical protein